MASKNYFNSVLSWLSLFKRYRVASSYQLWIIDLGEDPALVLRFLEEEHLIIAARERPIPSEQAPWLAAEMPIGSDTYSIMCAWEIELQSLGAVVSIERTPHLQGGLAS
ncbi:hypothetical protein [Polycladidibacter hongkongensis]|uniref:hypothetical protein n=1 Tax=Polycladidibacter hongkongensis TaxID=1647556 RepID=UPI000830855D|nr:hypothetical protein [Pseudovibrio hongkongensis]